MKSLTWTVDEFGGGTYELAVRWNADRWRRVDDVRSDRAMARFAAAVEPDAAARGSLVNAVERLLLEDGLLLPVATFEVQVGVGEDMDDLRILPDGTLDLSQLGG